MNVVCCECGVVWGGVDVVWCGCVCLVVYQLMIDEETGDT